MLEVEIEAPITTVGSYLFVEAHNLRSVVLGDTVTSIGNCAFERAYQLEDFYIGLNVKSIGIGSFCLCNKLTNITIHPKNTHFVFEDNVLIMDKVNFIHYVPIDPRKSYTIPSTITNVYRYSFYSTNNLETITIPSSVTTMGTRTFFHCDNLKKFVLQGVNNNFEVDSYGVLYNKNKTFLTHYPIGRTQPSFTIPNTVIRIADCAFCYSTTLTTLIIPSSVVELELDPWSTCTVLSTVTYQGKQGPTTCPADGVLTSAPVTAVKVPSGYTARKQTGFCKKATKT